MITYFQKAIEPGNGSSDDDDEEEDVSTALLKEVAALKETSKPSQRRFQQVRSGAKNILFIKTTVEDPVRLAHHIFSDVYESGKSTSRFIMRLLPVDGTCKIHTDLKDFEKMCRTLLAPHFEVNHGPTYCVMFKARNNNQIKKNDIYDSVGTIIEEMNTYSRVEFNKPDIIINVDVICTVCCVGVVKDFNKFRRYNLQEVVSAKQGGGKKGEVVTDSAKPVAEKKEAESNVDGTDAGSNPTEPDPHENDGCESKSSKPEDQEKKDAGCESKVEGSENKGDDDGTAHEGQGNGSDEGCDSNSKDKGNDAAHGDD